jgi:hypothetical protein
MSETELLLTCLSFAVSLTYIAFQTQDCRHENGNFHTSCSKNQQRPLQLNSSSPSGLSAHIHRHRPASETLCDDGQTGSRNISCFRKDIKEIPTAFQGFPNSINSIPTSSTSTNTGNENLAIKLEIVRHHVSKDTETKYQWLYVMCTPRITQV